MTERTATRTARKKAVDDLLHQVMLRTEMGSGKSAGAVFRKKPLLTPRPGTSESPRGLTSSRDRRLSGGLSDIPEYGTSLLSKEKKKKRRKKPSSVPLLALQETSEMPFGMPLSQKVPTMLSKSDLELKTQQKRVEVAQKQAALAAAKRELEEATAAREARRREHGACRIASLCRDTLTA